MTAGLNPTQLLVVLSVIDIRLPFIDTPGFNQALWPIQLAGPHKKATPVSFMDGELSTPVVGRRL